VRSSDDIAQDSHARERNEPTAEPAGATRGRRAWFALDPIDILVLTCRAGGRRTGTCRTWDQFPSPPMRTRCMSTSASRLDKRCRVSGRYYIFRRCRPIIVCFMHVRLFGRRSRCQWRLQQGSGPLGKCFRVLRVGPQAFSAEGIRARDPSGPGPHNLSFLRRTETGDL
jgi:hypothetical protein